MAIALGILIALIGAAGFSLLLAPQAQSLLTGSLTVFFFSVAVSPMMVVSGVFLAALS